MAEQYRLPVERVGTVDELARDAHAQARQMFPRVTQPDLGDIPVARLGITLSAHEHATLRPAPAIGEHTEQVSGQLVGLYPGTAAQALRTTGVLPYP